MWQESPEVGQYIEKGYEAREAGQLSDAMHYYEQALALKPNKVEAINSLGVIYEELGFPEKAEQKYLSVLKLDRDFLPVYFNLGSLYRNQGDIQKAKYYFQKRVKLGQSKDSWTIQAKEALQSIQVNEDVNRHLLINQTIGQVVR